MIRVASIAVLLAAGLVAGGCAEQKPGPEINRSPEASAKYQRDRDLCVAQSDGYMRDRRRVEDSSAGTFVNDQDRGRSGLSNQMANYGDSRNTDKFIASCMEARGWPQQQKSWWQKIGE